MATFATTLLVPVWAAGVFIAAFVVLWLSFQGHPVTAIVVTLAALASWGASVPLPSLEPGPIRGEGVMVGDVIEGRYGPYALIALNGDVILADLPAGSAALRGDRVAIEGMASGDPGTVGGRRHRGTVTVREMHVIAGPSSPFMAMGNAIRERVSERLHPQDGGRGLLAGFLVGDTTGIDPIDEEAMRRAGLSHYTAVSGSNVALFLTVLFIAVGPIGVGPRRRAAIGLLGLPVFAAATRFEPSVLRASAMAGIGLAGRLMGVGMEAWQVLSTAVTGLLLLDPTLASSVGFQLSVVAAAGVMVGGRWPVARRPLARPIAVTIGAQVAVAPLLVIHFGLVPLLSPLVNLVAAPVVALSTILGVIGMVGPGEFATAGAWLADCVLWLARLAAGWPQLGWVGLIVSISLVAVSVMWPRLRTPAVLAGAVATALLLVTPSEAIPTPGAVVLDVGQGDGILISGGDGHYALVDGGPDPVRLYTGLRRYGIRQLDLVVLTHVHADHAGGLVGLVGRVSIGRVWADPEPHETAASDQLLQLLDSAGVQVERPLVGQEWDLGRLHLTVEGPLRRYASPNDQSIVVMIDGAERSMLLSGDIEAIAQSELGHLRADVLKVPHHGAATSSLEWLDGVGSDLAVIPVGPNDFGHPSELVIEALEMSGDSVLRTDVEGDVLVPLG